MVRSIEPEENELRVDAFLVRHPQFAVEAPPPGCVPAKVVQEGGFLVTLPHVHGTDGAFAARLRRRTD